ncbi:hypothetical protein, partial [Enterococcus faecalis]|uniref:hypothetical protein n=1 Tax=Enterococcus faecalis TaxID=1351 RepID=UPI0039A51F65
RANVLFCTTFNSLPERQKKFKKNSRFLFVSLFSFFHKIILDIKDEYYWAILLFFVMIHVKSFVKEKENAQSSKTFAD